MAGSSREVRLAYKADISQLKSELSKVPGITEKEAKLMAKALEKQLVKAEKAAKKAAKTNADAFKKTNTSLKETSDAAGDADSALKGVAGALELVHPEAGRVLNVVGELGGGIEGLIRTIRLGSKVLGPLAIVAAAIGAAYKIWSDEQDRLTALQEVGIETQRRLLDMSAKLYDRTLDLKVATGELTEMERDLIRVRRQAMLEASPQMKEITTQITAQMGHLRKLEAREKQRAAGTVGVSGKVIKSYSGQSKALIQARSQLAALESQRSGMAAGIRKVIAVEDQLLEARDKQRKSTKASTAAGVAGAKTDAKRESARRSLAAIMERTTGDQLNAAAKVLASHAKEVAALDEVKRALGETDEVKAASAELEKKRRRDLLALIEDQDEVELTGVDLINAGLTERLAIIDEIKAAKLADFDADAERDKAMATRTKELTELRAESIATIRTQAKEAHDAEIIEIQDRRDAMLSAAGTAVDEVGGILSEIVGMQAEAQGDQGQRLFAFQKKLARTQIIMNGALAVSDILAKNAGSPIKAGVLTLMAAASAGVALAKVDQQTAPTFHAGGIIGRPASDSVQINALAGESVLTRQATANLGASGVAALNRGQTPTAQVVALPVYKHFDRFARDEVRRPGELRRAIKGKRRVGQRGY